jgi:hypothetical protein
MQYPRHYASHVEREFRRIGLDVDRLPGIMAGRGVGPADFLRWLRTIPGGTGHDAFVRRLAAAPAEGGPHAPGPDEPEAPDAATFRDPEIEQRIQFLDELDRVVPPSTIHGDAFGFELPHGRAHALAVLRSLPDGAGPDAFVNALQAAPPAGRDGGGRSDSA